MKTDEMIDSLIVDCNNAVKQITGGQYISWCGLMYKITSDLINLKESVQAERAEKENRIKTLQRFVDDLNNGGAENGSN